MRRAIVLLSFLSGLAWWLHGEQERGRFHEVDETFLDFLLANTRDQLKPESARLDDVVFVRLREEDKAEYAAWPPLPIDYLMVVKGLAAFEPGVVVIADPLSWPEPKPGSIMELAQVLLPIPSVVLAVGASTEGALQTKGDDRLPVLERLQGEPSLLPELRQFTQMPEAVLARQSAVGVVTSPQSFMALRHGSGAVPSLVLQALASATRTPFAHQRLRTGPGAGLHLGAELFVPLGNDGRLLPSTIKLPVVNGLELMTATVVDLDEGAAKTLGKGKTLVIGMDNDGPRDTSARMQAQAIASALALPHVHELTALEQLIAWVVAGLLSLTLLLVPKRKAGGRALLLLFLLFTASYVAFQSSMTWCPPAIPAVLIAAAGVFARLFGRSESAVIAAVPEA